MEYRFWRFRITAGKMDEFLEAWQSGVVPLREQFGFQLHGAWVLADANEFVWILGHDSAGGYDAVDLAYYQSSARRNLQPDPAIYIEEAEGTFALKAL